MASTGEVWKLGHRPALDGVRGIAILAVVVSHVSETRFPAGGAVGVAIFFVLSGYLITRLLLAEQARSGAISLGAFWLRRARRLLPALAVVMAVVPVIYWLRHDPRLGGVVVEELAAGLYVMDFVRASGHGTGGVLGVTWSLAVEEQFYLVWPLLLTVLLRQRANVTRLLVLLTVSAVLWRWLAIGTLDPERVAFAPDTNAFALLLGCLLASLERDGRLPIVPRQVRPLAVAAVVALGTVTPVGVDMLHAATVGALVGAAMILPTSGDGRGPLADPVLRWFGGVSYGWYLWHAVFVFQTIDGGPLTELQKAVAAVLALGVAWLSWRFVEQPVLRYVRVSRAADRTHALR